MTGLLDALGAIGSALDKPGRAVRGLLAGRPDEALAALPFSDSLGLTDPARRASGSDLLRALGADPGEGFGGDVAATAAEVGTDPLTYLGAGLGARLGGSAAEAALARGPRYATAPEDLARLVSEGLAPKRAAMAEQFGSASAGSAGDDMMARLLGDPAAAARVASEVPPGSAFLGGGVEGVALKTPTGDVVRVGKHFADPALGRPSAEGVLQPTRTLNVPMADSDAVWRVERTPLAARVDDPAYWRTGVPGVHDPGVNPLRQLDQTLQGQGLKFSDRHLGNVGVARGAGGVVIDPGALDVLPGYRGGFAPVTGAADPGPLARLLIELGGGDDAVRAAVEAGGRPNFGALYGTLGGAGGGYGGTLARALGSYDR